MQFSNELNACAALVEKGDPWRFRTVMAAPLETRAKLFPLYAFNVEVSRAPYLTTEPMIAEMRLQWWRDALEEIASDGPVRRHEVVSPLAGILSSDMVQRLDQLVAARRWDCYKDAFEDEAGLDTYLAQTSGVLMAVSAELLGTTAQTAKDAGYAFGVASWLRAIPALEAQHRIPLVDGSHDGVRALATKGMRAWNAARSDVVPQAARPAFWPAVGTDKVLCAAMQQPARVANGTLPQPSGIAFTLKALLNRW